VLFFVLSFVLLFGHAEQNFFAALLLQRREKQSETFMSGQ
jgi:hypothetical protein